MARLRYSRDEAQSEAIRRAEAFVADRPDCSEWRFRMVFPNILVPSSQASKQPVAWMVLFAPITLEDTTIDGGELWVAIDLETGTVGLYFR